MPTFTGPPGYTGGGSKGATADSMRPRLKDIRDEVRVVGDFQDTTAITNEFLNFTINAELQELYDFLVSLFEEYFEVNCEIDVDPDYDYVNLPYNFLKLCKASFMTTDGNYYTMERFSLDTQDILLSSWTSFQVVPGLQTPQYRLAGRQIYLRPSGALATGTKVRIDYIPQLAQLKAKQEIPIQIPVGWKDCLVVGAIARCCMREETDATPWLMKKEKIQARIKSAAKPRDAGQAPQTIDVYRRQYRRDP